MAKHPIDKLFENKLKSLEQKPSPNLWSDLENQLDAQSSSRGKKRTLVWLSVAATVLLLAIVGWRVWDNPKNGSRQENFAEKVQKKEIFESPQNKNQYKKENLEKNEDRNIDKNFAQNNSQKIKKKILKKLPSNYLKKKNNQDKKQTQKIIPHDVFEEDKEKQVVQNTNKEDMNNKAKSSDKIQVVVKVKLGKSYKNTNNIVAQNSEKKQKKGVFRKLKALKNGEQTAGNIKLFESSGEKALASIDD